MPGQQIKIAVVGVGNCCSSLIQGLFYYKKAKHDVPGLMHPEVAGYKISDIRPAAAFDVDKRKVGKDLSQAIFQKPNCTKVFYSRIPNLGVKVKMGPILDSLASHLKEYPQEKRVVASREKTINVAEELKKSGAEILINYLPVGSQKATEFYSQAALKANCAFINCIPVFIASDKKWAKKFREKNLPLVGDDVKSQVGATIIHRVLSRLFSKRGVKIDKSYQLNFGGNADFLNMLERARLKSKKISKTESVESQLSQRLSYDDLHIGPSDYIPWLKDNKICFIRLQGRKFGDVPVELELKLSVEDSPNSAGCVIDAIRLAKLALNKKIGGPLIAASAYLMKHPPRQFPDEEAREMVENFIVDVSQR